MDICLVDPKGIYRGLNVGLAYLASVLFDEGINVKVFDFNNNEHNIMERVKEISEFDVVGFSIRSITADSAMNILRRIKNKSREKSYALAGGAHVTICGPYFLEDNGLFDIGVIGEGEETLKDIVKFFMNEKDLKDIEGITYKLEDEVMTNSVRPPITNLDSLPFPMYDAFDSIGSTIDRYPIITSRGCPFTCTFCCAHKIMGKKWRARSPRNVISELIHAKKKYKIKIFDVYDDNFTLDMKRTKRICQLIIDENLGLTWECLMV